jgi:hypothetical protein
MSEHSSHVAYSQARALIGEGRIGSRPPNDSTWIVRVRRHVPLLVERDRWRAIFDHRNKDIAGEHHGDCEAH